MSDITAISETPKPDFHAFPARIPKDLWEELREYAESVDWSTNSALVACIRGWLWTAKNHWITGPDGQVLADWSTNDASGSAGHAYEIAATFRLPAAEAADVLPHIIRDRVIEAVDTAGGRDVETRLVSLAPMPPDPRCVEASCAHLEE